MDWLFGVKYKVWAINTTDDVELYLWENWKKLLPNVKSLIEISNAQPYIRTFQSYEFQNKWLGFGRMKWNEENNKKWTTKYRTNENKSEKLKFFSTEIWSPDWNSCCKTGRSPDIYINLFHNENLNELNEGLLIAMPKKIVNKNRVLAEDCIRELNRKIRNSSVSLEERYWTPSKEYPNRIEDMNPQELGKLIKKKGSE